MIELKEDMTNIYIGEGTVGIGVIQDSKSKESCGICIYQLKNKFKPGDKVDREEEIIGNPVNIIFTNRSGVESLIMGIERFVKAIIEDRATKQMMIERKEEKE